VYPPVHHEINSVDYRTQQVGYFIRHTHLVKRKSAFPLLIASSSAHRWYHILPPRGSAALTVLPDGVKETSEVKVIDSKNTK
jgi:hypothetical protein